MTQAALLEGVKTSKCSYRILRGQGETECKKNLKSKISSQPPFKAGGRDVVHLQLEVTQDALFDGVGAVTGGNKEMSSIFADQ